MQDAVLTAGQAVGARAILPLFRNLLFPGIPFAPLAAFGSAGPGVYAFSLLFWFALGGLLQRPGLFLAGLVAQTGLTLLFHIAYPGGYRHAALFLVFLIFLYWLAAEGYGGRWPSRSIDHGRRFIDIGATGRAAMLFLLALQVPLGVADAARLIRGQPESSSAALAKLLKRLGLRDAILLGDPDYHLEPLPYYVGNPIYLVREQRFGQVVRFSSRAKLHLELKDILIRAEQLRLHYRVPVVVMLADGIDPNQAPVIRSKGYVWTLKTTPAQVRAFQKATCHIARLDKAASDENYDVNLLPFPALPWGTGDPCGRVHEEAAEGLSSSL